MTYICRTIPRDVLEKTYGIKIIRPASDEVLLDLQYADWVLTTPQDPNRPPRAYELLNAYNVMRGFMNARGAPDGPRGARILLKDYISVSGVHPLVTPLTCVDRASCCTLRHRQAKRFSARQLGCPPQTRRPRPVWWATPVTSWGPRCVCVCACCVVSHILAARSKVCRVGRQGVLPGLGCEIGVFHCVIHHMRI